MSAAENLDLAMDIVGSLARIVKAGVETRHLREIRQQLAYLEGLGPAPRAEVGSIAEAARRKLAELGDEPGTTESD